MTKTSLVKTIKLKVGNDLEVATRLRDLLKDADDGFRRVVKVGLYIEWIAVNLQHGQLLPWIQEHCPEIPMRSIYNWRSLAKNLCEWSGLKFASLANLPISGDQLLDYKRDDLPAAVRSSRDKIDEALSSSTSAKQIFLFLGFKQAEIDSSGYPRKKRGRRKGEGGASREQRARVAALDAEAQVAADEFGAVKFSAWIDEVSDLSRLPRISDSTWATLSDRAAYLHNFMRQVNESRASARRRAGAPITQGATA